MGSNPTPSALTSTNVDHGETWPTVVARSDTVRTHGAVIPRSTPGSVAIRSPARMARRPPSRKSDRCRSTPRPRRAFLCPLATPALHQVYRADVQHDRTPTGSRPGLTLDDSPPRHAGSSTSGPLTPPRRRTESGTLFQRPASPRRRASCEMPFWARWRGPRRHPVRTATALGTTMVSARASLKVEPWLACKPNLCQ